MKTVDFYFDYSSTNGYFAAFLLPQICRKHEGTVNWLPIHLAAMFRGTGFDVMAMTPRKAGYLWRDHQRYAEFTGLPFRKPSRFPIKTSAALRATLMIPGLAGDNPDNYTAVENGRLRASSDARVLGTRCRYQRCRGARLAHPKHRH